MGRSKVEVDAVLPNVRPLFPPAEHASDPAEEALDLPAAPIDAGDQFRAQGLRVQVSDQAQGAGRGRLDQTTRTRSQRAHTVRKTGLTSPKTNRLRTPGEEQMPPRVSQLAAPPRSVASAATRTPKVSGSRHCRSSASRRSGSSGMPASNRNSSPQTSDNHTPNSRYPSATPSAVPMPNNAGPQLGNEGKGSAGIANDPGAALRHELRWESCVGFRMCSGSRCGRP